MDQVRSRRVPDSGASVRGSRPRGRRHLQAWPRHSWHRLPGAQDGGLHRPEDVAPSGARLLLSGKWEERSCLQGLHRPQVQPRALEGLRSHLSTQEQIRQSSTP